MTMARTVVPEELDNLDPVDPYAFRSRSDLKRVHRAMGTCSLLTRELSAAMGSRAAQASPLRVLELGAGDGSLMLRVARSLRPQWPHVQLTLLDQVNLLNAKTRAAYAAVGWTATPQVMDVLDWARDQTAQSAAQANSAPAWDLIVANLFLHHFEAADLRRLLAAIAQSCSAFVACEPRRSRFALAASHCVGALGACSVTRADAVTSVHAGFAGSELSALWPKVGGAWRLTERAVAPFSHCFTAQRSAFAQAD
jgi:2-polyprenyl-3-methyl-5-hydroxy-6-metoxy-1,4-benzoquinol methylase